MGKTEFYKMMEENYFEPKTFSLDILKEMIKTVLPVSGKIEAEVHTEVINERKLNLVSFIEIVEAETEPDVAEEIYHIFMISVDDDGVIETISKKMLLFTPANKNLMLFFGFLIGKKIENYQELKDEK